MFHSSIYKNNFTVNVDSAFSACFAQRVGDNCFVDTIVGCHALLQCQRMGIRLALDL